MTSENTFVIDNLVGLYGKELKLSKDDIIKINKTFHNVVDKTFHNVVDYTVDIVDSKPDLIESDLGDLIINPKFNRFNKLPELEKQLNHYKLQFKKAAFQ